MEKPSKTFKLEIPCDNYSSISDIKKTIHDHIELSDYFLMDPASIETRFYLEVNNFNEFGNGIYLVCDNFPKTEEQFQKELEEYKKYKKNSKNRKKVEAENRVKELEKSLDKARKALQKL